MANNEFKIEIPISVKGGRSEGEKIGKSIADQVKKALGSIGIGGTSKGGGSKIGGFEMGGFGKLLGKSTLVLGAILGVLTIGLKTLAKASPYLKGILSIFGRAMMIFFRPFGDFLATLLRPLAIALLKMAVAFLKVTRPLLNNVREAIQDAPTLPTDSGNMLIDLAAGIANFAFLLGVAIGQVAVDLAKAAFDLGTKIGQWLFDKVITPVADFISNAILGAFNWVKDIGEKIWNNILKPAWEWFKDIGTKIWEIIKSPFQSLADTIQSWADKISNMFGGGGGQGETTGGGTLSKVRGILNFGLDDIIKGLIKGSFATGSPMVSSDGIYQLHKGEQVISRSQSGGNRSVVLQPTFQINGNINNSLDLDELVRRAGRMTEMELKKRGII